MKLSIADISRLSRRNAAARILKGRRVLALIALGVLVAITCVGAAIRGFSDASRATGGDKSKPEIAETAGTFVEPAPVLSSPQSTAAQPEISGTVLTLRPQGFYPTEIVHNKGRFVLIVDNKTGLEEMSLQLDLEVGGRLRHIPVRRNKPLWGDIIELNPGRYVLSEANHPEWVCHITVSPR